MTMTLKNLKRCVVLSALGGVPLFTTVTCDSAMGVFSVFRGDDWDYYYDDYYYDDFYYYDCYFGCF